MVSIPRICFAFISIFSFSVCHANLLNSADNISNEASAASLASQESPAPSLPSASPSVRKIKKRTLKNPKLDVQDNKYRQDLVEEVKSEKPPEIEAVKLFEWEIIYKYELMRNTHGGVEVGTTELSNLDIKAKVNLDQFSWGKGLSGYIEGMGNYGSFSTDKVGDIQTSSNIEAPNMFFLYQAWVEKSILQDMFSVLVGLYEVNSEFYVTNTSLLFLNSSFGIGSELAISGANGPSTFPYTSLTARAKINFPNSIYALWSVSDGVPGNPPHATSNNIKWDSTEGLLFMTEVGTTSPISENEKAPEVFSKFGIGVWGYTGSFDPVDDQSGEIAQGNYGLYAIYDKTTSPRFSYFIRAGYANAVVSTVMANWSAGFNYRAPLSWREKDILGIGITDALLSSGYRRAQERDGIPMAIRETAMETTYRISVWEDFAVQPSYQYIVNPGGDKNLANAHVVTLHLEFGI